MSDNAPNPDPAGPVPAGFSRSNFAPLPHRHADLPLPADPSAPSAAAGLAAAPPPRRAGDEDVDLYRDLALPPREEHPYAPHPSGHPSGHSAGYPAGLPAPVRAHERGPPMRDGRDGRRGPPMRERERDMDPEREYESWERRMDEDRWGGPGGRRGREWEDDFDRPKRRRSPSPFGPPSHRARLHSPSPPPPRRHPAHELPDPASLEHLLTYRQFSEWFRASHPQTAKADEEELRRAQQEEDGGAGKGRGKVGMPKRFERYRREYSSRQLYALYLSHRSSPWFQERYSGTAENVALRRRLARQGRVPTVETYLDKLRVGEYDSVSYDLAEGEDTRHSAQGGARKNSMDRPEPEGLDRALDDVKRPAGGVGANDDDPLRIEVAPKDGQVFIKSVPPSVSRLELEEIFAKEEGFEYLALTEPSTKKSFHRVGWAQYKEGIDVAKVVERVDESKIDTFTYHMGVNTAPVVGRIRITQPIANTLERLLVDVEKAKALAVKLEEDLLGDDEESAGATQNGAANGVNPEDATGDAPAEENDERPKTEGEDGTGAPGVPRQGWEGRKWPGLRERGSGIIQERIDRLIEDLGLGGEDVDEEKQVKRAKLTLDQWLSYLRTGMSTCYYCIATHTFSEELDRKCVMHKRPAPVPMSTVGEVAAPEEGDEGVKQDTEAEDGAEPKPEAAEDLKAEARDGDGDEDMDTREPEEVKPASNGAGVGEGKKPGAAHGHGGAGAAARDKEQDERWAEYLDFRLAPLLLNPGDELDLIEYLGRDVEEETRKLCAPHIKQEEASKYRCKECNKLFKAPEFVIKHIASKHHELVKGKLEDIETFNNFALDPHHIPIISSTPAAVDDQLPPSLTNPMAALPVPLAMPIFNPDFPDRAPGGGRGGDRGGGRRRDRGGYGPPHDQPDASGGMGPGMLGAGGGMTVMQQQMMMMMQMQNAMMMGMGMGGGGAGGVPGAGGAPGAGPGMGGRGGRGGAGGGGGPVVHVGQPGTEDPRARRGRVSYRDLDDPSGPRGGGAGAGAAGGAGAGGGEDEGLPY